MSEITYFRVPDLLVVASEEEKDRVEEPSEFTLTLRGVITEYDVVVTCPQCNTPQHGEKRMCDSCKADLKDVERIKFWKLVPNLEDVSLDVSPFIDAIVDDT